MTDIDDYVETKLLPYQQEIVAIVRELMREYAPGADEVISRGSLAWKDNKILAITSVSRTHVTLAFARGAEFTDDHGLLEGTGKTTRHVKLKKPDAVRHEALRDYVRQAVALDRAG